MADVMPNYGVEQQRVVSDIATLTATVERQKLELLELKSRQQGLVENIAATKVSLEERKKLLAGLVKEHGVLTEESQDG